MADYTVQDLQDNLDYLNNTKQIIKQSIINKGQSISDSDTFRSYADKISAIETGKGDVKLFETEEEMQADAKAKEGDLAVVYRNEVNNVTADSRFQYITFPETVTLPTAVATDSFCMLRAVDSSTMFDGQVNLNNTSFSFNGYSETGMIRVEYSSADGINYTRTRFEGDNGELTNPVDLGTEVLIYGVNSFTANMGYFMQIDGSTFEGLYSYEARKDTDYAVFARNFKLDENNTLQFESTNIYIKDLRNYITNTILSSIDFTIGNFLVVKTSDNQFTLYTDNSQYASSDDCVNAGIRSNYDTDNTTYITRYNNNSDNSKTCHKFVVNTTDWTHEHTEQVLTQYGNADNISNLWVTSINVTNSIGDGTNIYLHSSTSSSISNYIRYRFGTGSVLQWRIALNQFTLTSPNQLLPGISAYGKNGIVIGDDTIYDNLDNEKVWNKIFNISTSISDYLSMQDEISPQYRLGNYSYSELSPNKLYAFNRDKDSDKYLLRNINNGNIFNIPIGVGNNVLYYYSRTNSNVTIYELNKTSNNRKSYDIDLNTTINKFSISVSNGLVYMMYSTNGEDIYIKRYNLETQELDELYYNADDLDFYFGTIVAAQGNAIYTYRNKQNKSYNINLINGTTKQITTLFSPTGTATVYGYSEDQKIIYGNYMNPTRSWWVYDFTTSQFYTFDTDVAPSNGQLCTFCDANKVFLGFKSDGKNISIYNTDTHSLYLQPITNFNGNYSSDFIFKKDRYIYTSGLYANCKINLDTFTAEPLSISFYSPNDSKYPIDIEETSTSVYIVRPSTEGLSYETCYKVTASSIDLTKTNDFIILFTYRTNTTDQVMVVFVDNTLSDGVLTQEEYNKALATAKQIEGSE